MSLLVCGAAGRPRSEGPRGVIFLAAVSIHQEAKLSNVKNRKVVPPKFDNLAHVPPDRFIFAFFQFLTSEAPSQRRFSVAGLSHRNRCVFLASLLQRCPCQFQ